MKTLGFVPSVLRHPTKPNQLTAIPAGVTITRVAPRQARGIVKQKMRAKGFHQYNVSARWEY